MKETPTLKQKFHHFDEILTSGFIRKCQFECEIPLQTYLGNIHSSAAVLIN